MESETQPVEPGNESSTFESLENCPECGSDEIYFERFAPDHNGEHVCQDCGQIITNHLR